MSKNFNQADKCEHCKTKSATIIPAQPGYFVCDTYIEGRDHVLTFDPVIAWEIIPEAEGRAYDFSTAPIGLAGSYRLELGGYLIKHPDGHFTAFGSPHEPYDDDADAIAYFKRLAARQS